MSLIIIGKMGIAGVGIAVASWGGIALTRWLQPADVEIYGFLTVELQGQITQQAQQKDSSLPDAKKELECKIPDFNKFDCTLEIVTKLDKNENSKNHVSWEQLTSTASVEAIKEKLEDKKFYKITISASVFSDPTPTQSSTPATTPSWNFIEIFEKDDSKKLGSINTLFQIKNAAAASTLETWKTNYFIGQASTVTADLTEISGYKCSWGSSSTAGKECTIKPFVAEDTVTDPSETAKITDLTFTKDANLSASKKITQHHYYLIEFTESDDSKELKSFTETEIVYLKDASETAKVTFSKLSAVQVVGDQLLILKKHQEA